MVRSLFDSVRRLAHPRSRRSQLWACVYCGVFDGEVATQTDEPGSS